MIGERHYVVFTAIGPDRPGLVREIPSTLVLSHLRAELRSRCDEENLDFTLEVRP